LKLAEDWCWLSEQAQDRVRVDLRKVQDLEHRDELRRHNIAPLVRERGMPGRTSRGNPPRVRETAPAAPIGHQLVTKSLEGALSSTYTPLLVGLRQPMLAYH